MELKIRNMHIFILKYLRFLVKQVSGSKFSIVHFLEKLTVGIALLLECIFI